MKAIIINLILVLMCLPSLVWAGAAITYHGRILDQTDRPLEAANVTFRIRIYSPNPSKCLLYEEKRNIDMTNSKGVFVIPIGDGTGTRGTQDPGLTIEKIFANNGVAAPGLICNTGNSYTPQPLDQRQMLVSYDDHSGYGWDDLPSMDLNYVPLAVNAHDAQNVGGTPASSVLRVDGGTAPALTSTDFTELMKIIGGTTSQYAKSGQLNGAAVPTLNNGQVLGWSGGAWSALTPLISESDPSVKSFAKADLPTCNAGEFLVPNGSGGLQCVGVSGASGGTVTSITAGTGLKNATSPGDPIVSSGTLAVDVGTSSNQIVQLGADTKLPAVDGSKLTNVVAEGLSNTASINTSGNITSSQMRTKSLYIENATPNRVLLTVPASLTDYTWVLPSAQGTNGQVLGMSSTAGQLEWKTLSPSGVSSVTADAPVVIDSSTPSSPKVTLPKATAAVNGYLDKNDFTTFSSKQAAGNYLITLQGDVTSSNFSSGTVDVTVNKIKNVPVSAAPSVNGQVLRYESGSLVPSFVSMLDLRSNVTGTLALSSTCGTSQTLTFNSATDSLKCESISIGKGQVSGLGSLADKSAVDLATADVTNILPISKGGTGASSVAQALVFAGPTSGTGAPSFRALASTDLPESASYWQAATGGINYAGGRVGLGTTTPAAKLDVVGNIALTGTIYNPTADNSSSVGLAADTVASTSTASVRVWGAAHATYPGDVHLISKSAGGIKFYNYNSGWTEQMRIEPSGFVGMGTATPQTALDVRTPVLSTALHPFRAGIIASGEGTDVTGRIAVRSAGDAEVPYFMAYRSRGTLASPTAVKMNDILGGFIASSYDGAAWSAGGIGGGVYLSAAEDWSATNHGSLISFHTTTSGNGGTYNERMRIDPYGRVGVGTNAPNAILHVYGGAYNSGIKVESNSISGTGVTLKNIDFGGTEWNIFSSGSGNGGGSGKLNFYNTTSSVGVMFMTSAGSVGIGNASPQYTLDVNGSFRSTSNNSAWSDLRAKKNIEVIPEALKKIEQIRGVTFDWRLDEFPDKKFKTTRDMGVIAQEIEKVFPEAVQTDGDGYKSVNYSSLIAPLIEGVKALYQSVSRQDRDIASLKDQLDLQDQKMSTVIQENIQLRQENADIKKYLCSKDPRADLCD